MNDREKNIAAARQEMEALQNANDWLHAEERKFNQPGSAYDFRQLRPESENRGGHLGAGHQEAAESGDNLAASEREFHGDFRAVASECPSEARTGQPARPHGRPGDADCLQSKVEGVSRRALGRPAVPACTIPHSRAAESEAGAGLHSRRGRRSARSVAYAKHREHDQDPVSDVAIHHCVSQRGDVFACRRSLPDSADRRSIKCGAPRPGGEAPTAPRCPRLGGGGGVWREQRQKAHAKECTTRRRQRRPELAGLDFVSF
ncbi:structural maintenance of chromosome 2, related [Neospora caninum Liverpool]|uniref:Structural maintenance of chromosome 2, related n=1 Tax=Neospora caninum (strain Liverpool) TaxID=572307 RepID=F0V904_NEOCL|nr:structural maintenance of chromosome 2, related [Neospora caninum Liverpool]CBZ50195.1 structural maintenance of chromosome 2, related [Neospora caninum Liverpool]|eukprot:XP_003880230.1 structural maintenance of chromosome 2, related [Neospora caninum Liverpool]